MALTGCWNTLAGGTAFHGAFLQDAVRLAAVGAKGWVSGLLQALQRCQYPFRPTVQDLGRVDVGRLRAGLTEQQRLVWENLDVCPRTAPTQGAKLCTYARWFRRPSWQRSSLLLLPITHAAMKRVLRFRTGCHGLPRDLGAQQNVPRRERLCRLCGDGLGDEMHVVFECAALRDLRAQFAPIFDGPRTMQQFMWQPNLALVARFVDLGMRRMEADGPDAGSDI